MRVIGIPARRLLAALVPFALCAAACGPSLKVRGNEALTDEQVAPYRLPGTSTVEGQVIVRPANGPVQLGSDADVRIMPMTTESDDYVQNTVLAGGTDMPKDTFRTPSWFAQADASGRFRFTQMAAGNYYVLCPLAWVDGGERHKAIALGRAQVAAGATAQIEVSPAAGR